MLASSCGRLPERSTEQELMLPLEGHLWLHYRGRVIRTILETCAQHLASELAHRSLPENFRIDIEMTEDRLEVFLERKNSDGEVPTVWSASFGVLADSEMSQLSDMPEARLELWSRAFVTAQLDEEPALTAAGPALLFRDELETEDDMLRAMRDMEYASWAQQILESAPQTPPREACEQAIESGNALWVNDLLTVAPELLQSSPEEESLLHLAAQQCFLEEHKLVLTTLLEHGARPDAKGVDGETAIDVATSSARSILENV